MNRILFTLLVSSLCVSLVSAQGRTDYMNVESPQAHPIEVFSVAGHDFIAACNTRNNTLEIYDSVESLSERRVAVVRVGLEPVAVRFHAGLSKLYTANFLGDSISVIDVQAPLGQGTLSATLDRTTWVGDEPIDLAFHTFTDTDGSTRNSLFVTHMALDGFDWRDAGTLQPIQGVAMAAASVPVGFDTSGDGVPDEFVTLAAKEPRSVRVRNGTLYILSLKGGSNSLVSLGFDLDYYCNDLADGLANPRSVGNLGTTGFAMDFDTEGNLYVVGGEARNDSLANEAQVRDAATGFVTSVVYLVKNPCSENPIVLRRDVNLEYVPVPVGPDGAVSPSPQGRGRVFTRRPATPAEMHVVPKNRALSMLTDVVVFEPGSGLRRVFFTAFGNDRVGVLETSAAPADPERWLRGSIDLPRINGNPLAGPSGIALKPAHAGSAGDPGDRLYVLDHLDNAIVTLNPWTEQVVAGASLSLSHDPRPPHLTAGQRFLYDAKLSGNGFVSCASCHVFGRTDGRVWDLGTPGQPAPPIPAILPEGIDDTAFAPDKNGMVTQSLQGLLNFEVAPANQFWVTNAPYHWRGDRASFRDFNGAFASLLGGTELEPEQMAQFEEFANTITYPPNPKERPGRVPSGVFGNGEDLSSDGSSGAFRGQKIFHAKPSVGARSCATGCHAGLEGSDNRLTESGLGAGAEPGNPIEVAALRGLFQKEGKRDLDGSSDPKSSPYTRVEGLFHLGLVPNGGIPGFPDPIAEFNLVASINAFNKAFFSGSLCGAVGSFCTDLQAVSQYVHEFDWGVGPLVGCAQTVSRANAPLALPAGHPAPTAPACDSACSDLRETLRCMEEQAAQANSGVAVHASLAGQERGFWYDPGSGLYKEEPVGASLSRAALVGLVVGGRDRLVFQAVPLGSERRVAAPGGIPSSSAPGVAPSSLKLLPMVADSFHERVPELTHTWADFDNGALGSIFVHTVRLFQWGLILDGASENGFGIGSGLRHDAPRRFQVSGDGIKPGAQLVLGYRNAPGSPPDPAAPLAQAPFDLIALPLHPTGAKGPDQKPIWQTAVEFEPLSYYALMLGGPFAPGVAASYFDQRPFTFSMIDPAFDKPPMGQFDPLEWNWIYTMVSNPDGTLGDGGWQRLRIEAPFLGAQLSAALPAD